MSINELSFDITGDHNQLGENSSIISIANIKRIFMENNEFAKINLKSNSRIVDIRNSDLITIK